MSNQVAPGLYGKKSGISFFSRSDEHGAAVKWQRAPAAWIGKSGGLSDHQKGITVHLLGVIGANFNRETELFDCRVDIHSHSLGRRPCHPWFVALILFSDAFRAYIAAVHE
jgi:hypothetical protein